MQNVVHLAIVAALVGPFLTDFGLGGAVLVTLLATAVVKASAVRRISRLMGVRVAQALPWKQLATARRAARSAAAVPALLDYAGRRPLPPLAALVLCGAGSYGLGGTRAFVLRRCGRRTRARHSRRRDTTSSGERDIRVWHRRHRAMGRTSPCSSTRSDPCAT